MKIGIAGIGGIGSNVARILAQAGADDIKIVDFDQVEAANLNRQFYKISQVGRQKTLSLADNLKDILPRIRVDIVDKQIRPGEAEALFSDCALVVEGFDDKQMKKMLMEELAESNKPLVCASGIAGKDLHSVKIRKIGTCHVVGDFTSDQADFALFPPKIAMITALMADIVIKEMEGRSHE